MNWPRFAAAKMRGVATALAIVATFGCQQRADEPSGVTGASVVTATAVVNSVELRLEAPSVARRGTDVPIRLTVSNKGEQLVAFNVSDRLEFDVVVRGADGSVVWQRSGGQPTTGVVVLSDPLAPGASRRFEARWAQRDAGGRVVPPGRYAIEGIALAGLPLSGIHVGPLDVEIQR